MMAASKTEDYQLLGEVLDPRSEGVGLLSRRPKCGAVSPATSSMYWTYTCSKGKNCSYKFYWPSFGMA